MNENKNIILALCEAKKQFKPVIKDKSNQFFKSKYADLENYIEATQDALCANGLLVTQTLDERGIVTTIYHAYSEKTISSIVFFKDTKTPQEFGSMLTYLRRYSYAAILGLASEDDDANESSKSPQKNEQKKAETQNKKIEATPELPKAEIITAVEGVIDTSVLPRIKDKFNLAKDKLKFLEAAQAKLEKENQDATDYQLALDWIIERRNEIIKQGETE